MKGIIFYLKEYFMAITLAAKVLNLIHTAQEDPSSLAAGVSAPRTGQQVGSTRYLEAARGAIQGGEVGFWNRAGYVFKEQANLIGAAFLSPLGCGGEAVELPPESPSVQEIEVDGRPCEYYGANPEKAKQEAFYDSTCGAGLLATDQSLFISHIVPYTNDCSLGLTMTAPVIPNDQEVSFKVYVSGTPSYDLSKSKMWSSLIGRGDAIEVGDGEEAPLFAAITQDGTETRYSIPVSSGFDDFDLSRAQEIWGEGPIKFSGNHMSAKFFFEGTNDLYGLPEDFISGSDFSFGFYFHLVSEVDGVPSDPFPVYLEMGDCPL